MIKMEKEMTKEELKEQYLFDWENHHKAYLEENDYHGKVEISGEQIIVTCHDSDGNSPCVGIDESYDLPEHLKKADY